jgi:hypothetical protein
MRFTKMSLGLLAALAASVVVGCGDKPATPANNAPPSIPAPPTAGTVSAPPPTPKVDNLLHAKPDVVMEPKAFSTELFNNRSTFGNKYRDKIIDVSGLVMSYDYADNEGHGFLFFADPLVKYGCLERHPMSKVAPGQTVTLRCQWREDMPRHPWSIVRVEGPSPPVLSAEQLAMAIASGKDETS